MITGLISLRLQLFPHFPKALTRTPNVSNRALRLFLPLLFLQVAAFSKLLTSANQPLRRLLVLLEEEGGPDAAARHGQLFLLGGLLASARHAVQDDVLAANCFRVLIVEGGNDAAHMLRSFRRSAAQAATPKQTAFQAYLDCLQRVAGNLQRPASTAIERMLFTCLVGQNQNGPADSIYIWDSIVYLSSLSWLAYF